MEDLLTFAIWRPDGSRQMKKPYALILIEEIAIRSCLPWLIRPSKNRKPPPAENRGSLH